MRKLFIAILFLPVLAFSQSKRQPDTLFVNYLQSFTASGPVVVVDSFRVMKFIELDSLTGIPTTASTSEGMRVFSWANHLYVRKPDGNVVQLDSTWAGGGGGSLRVRESDGAPTVGTVDSIDVNASNLVITNPSGNRAVINTIQDIGITASPTFGTPTLDGITPSSSDFSLNLGLPFSVLWIDGDNFLKPVVLGAAGTVLTSNSETSAPSFTAAGSGDITSVVAGDGLSGGATSGDATLTANVSATGGLQITSDSLKAKLYGTTLTSTANGLSVDTAVVTGTNYKMGLKLAFTDSANYYLAKYTASTLYLPIGQRPKVSVTGSAAVNDSLRFINGTGITVTNSSNAFTVTGTDTTSLSNRINLKAANTLTITAGDGLSGGGNLTTDRTITANVLSAGGLQITSDSLDHKLYGTTLKKSVNGLEADTAILATQYDLTQIGSLGVTQQTELFEDFLSANGTGNTGWIQTVVLGGTTANIAPVDTSRMGVLSLTTGTTAGISSGGVNYGTVSFSASGGELLFEASVHIPTLSTSSQYKVSIGFMDSPSTAVNTDGVYFMYSDSSSGKWICVTDSANSASPVRETRTVTDSIVAAGRWYRLKAVINATGSSVSFYINGTLVPAPHTRNIPRRFSPAQNAFAPTIKIVEITSDATSNAMYVDYFYLRKTYTAVR